MPLLILEGNLDLGHFAPPNGVSQNAPPLLRGLAPNHSHAQLRYGWVIMPLDWLSNFAPPQGGTK